jgi:hypothetical protein
VPAPRGTTLAVRFAELQAKLGEALRSTWARSRRPRAAPSRRVERWKEGLSHHASTVLASLSLLCLLLAATRASLISHARAHTIETAQLAALPAAMGKLEDECPPAPPVLPVPLELNARPATLIPSPLPEPTRPVEVRDPRERTRSRAPIRRAPPVERASCDPPFMIDDAGIRRIKPNCL